MRKERGITLIALVITIIVLIILAGVTISLIMGENGLIEKARSGSQAYDKAEAREKLEIALAELRIDKNTKKEEYNEDYIDEKLTEENMIVEGNTVEVEGWKFEIDKESLTIVGEVGKGNINNDIKIEVTSSIEADFSKGKITVVITYAGEIEEIKINDNIENVEGTNGVYRVEKEIEANGTYTVYVKDGQGNYKTESIKINNIIGDLDIYTVEDLVAFRDLVDAGATYEGKTVRLMNDLELNEITGEGIGSWNPIGYFAGTAASVDNIPFKGTFDGQGNEIDYLYINTTEAGQGLFAITNGGTIKNLGIGENSSITGGAGTGGIIGSNYNGSTIENCYNLANITGNLQCTGGIAGYGMTNSTVKNCYNRGEITCNGTNSSGQSQAGGITGGNSNGCTVENCYNTGNVTAVSGETAGIVGYNGGTSGNTVGTVKNVYNTGIVKVGTTTVTSNVGTSSSRKGIFIGYSGSVTGAYGTTIDETALTNLGSAFTADTGNINDGYPILTWQVTE